MPTMPQKLAGWRIEPPVSVPVAAIAARAATAAAEPPDEPPPRILDLAIGAGHVGRAHGELVHVALAQHDRAGLPQLRRDRRFIGRLEAVEDARARGRADALGAEQVLD